MKDIRRELFPRIFEYRWADFKTDKECLRMSAAPFGGLIIDYKGRGFDFLKHSAVWAGFRWSLSKYG